MLLPDPQEEVSQWQTSRVSLSKGLWTYSF